MQSEQSVQQPCSFPCIVNEGTVVVGSTKSLSTLRMGPIGYRERSVRNDHYSPRKYREE